jgi:hypothetical protein
MSGHAKVVSLKPFPRDAVWRLEPALPPAQRRSTVRHGRMIRRVQRGAMAVAVAAGASSIRGTSHTGAAKCGRGIMPPLPAPVPVLVNDTTPSNKPSSSATTGPPKVPPSIGSL